MTPGTDRDGSDGVAAAERIGRRLAAAAVWHRGRCTWVGRMDAASSAVAAAPVHGTAGPDLYTGTSGIALFLAHLARVVDAGEFRETATGAARHALRHSGQLIQQGHLGFYAGAVGVAAAVQEVGALLGEPDLRAGALALARRAARRSAAARSWDQVYGLAGVLSGLLRMMGTDPAVRADLTTAAQRVSRHLMRAASRSDRGWSWPTPGIPSRRDLTGFSHGAAGIGHALVDAHAATGAPGVLRGAQEAFRYEQSYFTAGRWPDFRGRGSASTMHRPSGHGMEYWCHGAPGIAVSRLRAYEVTGDEQYLGQARVALALTRSSLRRGLEAGSASHSTCHGLVGNAEVLALAAGAGVGDAEDRDLVSGVADSARRYERQVGRVEPGTLPDDLPSLMLGQAGIGLFLLWLGDRDVPLPVSPGHMPVG